MANQPQAPTVEQAAERIIGAVFSHPEQRQRNLEAALKLLTDRGLDTLEKMRDHMREQTGGSCERRNGI